MSKVFRVITKYADDSEYVSYAQFQKALLRVCQLSNQQAVQR